MTSYERLASNLKSLGLYRLDGTTKIDAELKAYGALLDKVYEKIDILFKSSFVDQLSGIGFKNYIKLFGVSESLSNATVQSLVLKRLFISSHDFTPAGVIRCIDAGGLSCTINENTDAGTAIITITADRGFFKTREEKEYYVKGCMPCRITPTIVWAV